MIKIILSIMLALVLLNANETKPSHGSCILAQTGDVTVNWESYKTAAKIGVGGTFDSVKYTAAAPSGINFSEILVGSIVVIDTNSVNSKNKGRDETLVKYFFKQMSSNSITAKIVEVTSSGKHEKDKPKTGTLATEITMNGITKKVPMSYSYDAGILNVNGFIDLFDFSANKALSSINKACFDLHSGKTWSDVAIGFSTKIKATLCSSKPAK